MPAGTVSSRVPSAALAPWAGALAVFLLDQGSKALVRHTLALQEVREVIPGFFHLRHVLNDGAAWSILSGARWPLVAVSVVALAALVVWRREVLALGPRLGGWVLALLSGGIAGNLVDRLATGRVVDFLDFVFGTYHYPTFNVADSAICCGVALYVWASLRAPRTPAP